MHWRLTGWLGHHYVLPACCFHSPAESAQVLEPRCVFPQANTPPSPYEGTTLLNFLWMA